MSSPVANPLANPSANPPAAVSARGDEENRDEIDRDELEQEVSDLKADAVYGDFVHDLVKGRDLKGDVDQDEDDPEFIPEEIQEKIVREKDQEEDERSSSSSNDSSEEEDEQDEEENEDYQVQVPADMAAEANARFPFLWRTRNGLARAAANDISYKSEDDPTYDPENSDMEDNLSQDGEEGEVVVPQEVEKVDEPMLAELVSDMTELELEAKEAQAQQAGSDQAQHQPEQMLGAADGKTDGIKSAELYRAILEIDDKVVTDGGDEIADGRTKDEDDPDFEPSADSLLEAEHSQDEDEEGDENGKGDQGMDSQDGEEEEDME